MNETEPKRAVAYIRVSDLSQVEGYSLDAQERLFRELCSSRGWEPYGVYREEGKSAHVDSVKKRPVFRQLLEDSDRRLFDVVGQDPGLQTGTRTGFDDRRTSAKQIFHRTDVLAHDAEFRTGRVILGELADFVEQT